MSTYYSGRRARHYNARWRTYSERTLAETLAVIDVAALRRVPERLGRFTRLLDVPCVTGLLLKRLLDQMPGAEAYGVDSSEDMLTQARAALKGRPHVHLEYVRVGEGPTADLPFAQETFDLITYTNVLHDMPQPAAMLLGLRKLLAPGGQLVVEDFARRESPFPLDWLWRGWVVCAYRTPLESRHTRM